jgi:lambda family phage portal protein
MDTVPDLPTLRARSRDLERHAPLARGALNTNVINVVGTGLTVLPRIDREFLGLSEEEADAWERQAQRLFNAWAETESCDLTREQDFAGLTSLALLSTLLSGDVLSVRRFKRRQGDLFATKVQLVEADRISNPRWAPNTDLLIEGVELDEDGAAIAYHVLDHHPGDAFGVARQTWKRVPAFGPEGSRTASLLFQKRRPGQPRGVPYLAPVIETLKQLDTYGESELQSTVVASFFTAFVKTVGGGAGVGLESLVEDENTEEARDITLGPGIIAELDEGEDVAFANPMRPNATFDAFVKAFLRQVGVGLDLPYEVLVKHFTASYSASRAALLEARKAFRTLRRWLVGKWCRPWYAAVVEEAVARGLLDAPGFFERPLVRRAWLGADWAGAAAGQIDPKKEAEAARTRVEAGFSTLQQETAELTGGDWEANHEQRAKEIRLRREAGLEEGSSSASAEPGTDDPDVDGRDDDTEDETGGDRRGHVPRS